MNRKYWRLTISLVFLTVSTVLYFVHYFIFRDTHHIFLYLVGDIAFLFTDVLIVTLIIDQLLHIRDKKTMMQKRNTIIGVFFIEIGNDLLKQLSAFDTRAENIRSELSAAAAWTKDEFTGLISRLKNAQYKMESRRADLLPLKTRLFDKKEFILRLLENPNLLEHEQFTDLLWAVVHLAEELAARKNLTGGLPEADYKHLSGDILRAYAALVSEWLNHMNYLREFYPYLFSLAVRTNPFDPLAVVEIQG